MPSLTRRQQQILDHIRREQEQAGNAPTLAEIARHFGFRSLNAVSEHLRLIRQKGFLEASTGRARSLRIVSPLQRFRQRVADIPVFGSIPAGLPQERTQEAKGCVSIDIGTLNFKPTPRTFALEVRGDSMVGKHIIEGDLVVLEHGATPKPGDVVAALIDGESTLKTFLTRNGKPYLKAENPNYPDLLPAQELVIQGVLRLVVRRAR
ncbi:MAG: repressor LexA [Limisphaerales bacterium]|nr:MAG: repressor LexA [Limisphaerales bacterium]TXT49031.1 MAG: repressor LexA [Limisphaerales bacterium]